MEMSASWAVVPLKPPQPQPPVGSNLSAWQFISERHRKQLQGCSVCVFSLSAATSHIHFMCPVSLSLMDDLFYFSCFFCFFFFKFTLSTCINIDRFVNFPMPRSYVFGLKVKDFGANGVQLASIWEKQTKALSLLRSNWAEIRLPPSISHPSDFCHLYPKF